MVGPLPRREQDDGKIRVARLPSELATERNTIEFWHHPIGDQEGKRLSAIEKVPGLYSVFDAGHVVAPARECRLEQAALEAIVIGDQYPHPGVFGRIAAGS